MRKTNKSRIRPDFPEQRHSAYSSGASNNRTTRIPEKKHEYHEVLTVTGQHTNVYYGMIRLNSDNQVGNQDYEKHNTNQHKNEPVYFARSG
jgi:hypothetical protein